MGNFGFAGAAAGASDALQQVLARKLIEQQQRDALALQQQRIDQDADELAFRKSQATQAATERAQDRRTESARIVAGLVGPGVELSPDQAATFKETPYAALVEEHATLPSRTIDATGISQADAGGRSYATLRPTAAQQREAGEREGRRRVVDLVKRGAPRQDILSAMSEAGQTITPRDLEDPAAVGQADHQRRLAEIQASGVQSRITQAAADAARRRAAHDPVITPRDRQQAMRQADAAAADFIDSQKDAMGLLPIGVDADAIRQQFIDDYLSEIETPAGRPTPRQTRRVIDGLSRIVAAPTRTGGQSRGMMVDSMVIPVGGGRTPRAAATAGGGDAYEQYLARTGGR
ncbi:MAG: hypothetical protein FJW14_07890 [Acidimicrobiia bacterium]|nr:hypothetical protein [Acidimicrobiia bacterium]